jgi:hypothetical protein
MSAPDEYKRGKGAKAADEAIERSKEAMKPAPLPPPKKGGKPKRIGEK